MSRTSRKDTQRLSRRQFLGATAGTAIAAIAHAGATIIDNLNITALESPTTGASEFNILLFDFKSDVAAYLATRSGGPKTLQDLIDFNTAHAAQELKFIPTLPT